MPNHSLEVYKSFQALFIRATFHLKYISYQLTHLTPQLPESYNGKPADHSACTNSFSISNGAVDIQHSHDYRVRLCCSEGGQFLFVCVNQKGYNLPIFIAQITLESQVC